MAIPDFTAVKLTDSPRVALAKPFLAGGRVWFVGANAIPNVEVDLGLGSCDPDGSNLVYSVISLPIQPEEIGSAVNARGFLGADGAVLAWNVPALEPGWGAIHPMYLVRWPYGDEMSFVRITDHTADPPAVCQVGADLFWFYWDADYVLRLARTGMDGSGKTVLWQASYAEIGGWPYTGVGLVWNGVRLIAFLYLRALDAGVYYPTVLSWYPDGNGFLCYRQATGYAQPYPVFVVAGGSAMYYGFHLAYADGYPLMLAKTDLAGAGWAEVSVGLSTNPKFDVAEAEGNVHLMISTSWTEGADIYTGIEYQVRGPDLGLIESKKIASSGTVVGGAYGDILYAAYLDIADGGIAGLAHYVSVLTSESYLGVLYASFTSPPPPPVWVYPTSQNNCLVSSVPELIFQSPVPESRVNLHFRVSAYRDPGKTNLMWQKDTVASPELFEYYDGATWQPFPATGLPPSAYGTQIRVRAVLEPVLTCYLVCEVGV